MNTLAVQGVGFGSTYRNNIDKPATHKSQNNEPTVTIPRSKYEELRRYAAKGAMAIAMATAVMGTGTAVTSCSKTDDVPEIKTQTDNIDVQGQATFMKMLQIIGVPITTNDTNPKYVKTFSTSEVKYDYQVIGDNYNCLKGDWTYNEQLSTKDKSVYISADSKQLVITKEDNDKNYELKGILTQSGQNQQILEFGINTLQKVLGDDRGGLLTHRVYNDGEYAGGEESWGLITASDKGPGHVNCDTGDLDGDVQVSAMAK